MLSVGPVLGSDYPAMKTTFFHEMLITVALKICRLFSKLSTIFTVPLDVILLSFLWIRSTSSSTLILLLF